jgi:hypothetical protein
MGGAGPRRCFAQRTGAHARPKKPTSFQNSMLNISVVRNDDDLQLEQWDQSSIAIGEPPFFIEVIEIDPLKRD